MATTTIARRSPALLRACRNFVANHVNYVNNICYNSKLRDTVCFPAWCKHKTIYKRQHSAITESVANTESISAMDIDLKIVLLYSDTLAGRIYYGAVEEILEALERTHSKVNSIAGIVLLKCCGVILPDVTLEVRHALTKRIWNLIRDKSQLSLTHYNTLLNTFIENNMHIDVHEFLQNMQVEPDQTTYTQLLNIVCNMGDEKSINYIMSIIKEQKYDLCEQTFNALIQGYCVQDKISVALQCLERMQAMAVKPSAETYCILACEYARKKQFSDLMSILNQGDQNVKNIMKIVKALNVTGSEEIIPKVLVFLPESIKDNKTIIKITIAELIHAERVHDAKLIINQVLASENNADVFAELIHCFLNELIRSNNTIDNIFKIAEDFTQLNNPANILTKMAEITLLTKKESMALVVFEVMKQRNVPVRCHYYWPLLLHAYKNSGEEKLHSLIQHMTNLKINVDCDTIIDYVLPYVTTADVQIAVTRLRADGVSKKVVLTSMVSHLLMNQRWKEGIALSNLAQGKVFHDYIVEPLFKLYKMTGNIQICANILLQLSENAEDAITTFLTKMVSDIGNDPAKIIEYLSYLQKADVILLHHNVRMLRTLVNNNVPYNEDHISSLLNSLCNEKGRKYAPTFKHPNDMVSHELAAHLAELKSKNMNTRGVLRRLLQAYSKENKLEEVEALKEEFDTKCFAWTAGMKMSLFDLYVKNHMLRKATCILSEMQETFPTFPIDNFKILQYCTKLVYNNQIQEAFATVRECKHVNQKINSNAECWKLLNALAMTTNYDNTNNMLNLLVSRGYCKINNVLLGPLIDAHLITNDIVSAVTTFKMCASLYKHAPQHQKLTTAIINSMTDSQLHNKSQLQDVWNIVVGIRGQYRAALDTIIALADCQKITEMRSMLKATSMHAEDVIEATICTPDQKRIKILLTIIEASHDIPSLDKSLLCDAILSVCSKTGDCASALTLWDKMMRLNIKLSQHFQNMLDPLLLSHKINLPAETNLGNSQINTSTFKTYLRVPFNK